MLGRLLAPGAAPGRRKRPGRHPLDGRLGDPYVRSRHRPGLRHRRLLRRDADQRPAGRLPGRLRGRRRLHGRTFRLLRHHRRLRVEQCLRQRHGRPHRAGVGRPGPRRLPGLYGDPAAYAALARHRGRHPALPRLRGRDQAMDERPRSHPDPRTHRLAPDRLDPHPLRLHRRPGARRGHQRAGRRPRPALRRHGRPRHHLLRPGRRGHDTRPRNRLPGGRHHQRLEHRPHRLPHPSPTPAPPPSTAGPCASPSPPARPSPTAGTPPTARPPAP